MSGTRVPEWLRQRVSDEARHRCGYCLMAEQVVGMPMELDHLVPEALGGATEAENLCWPVRGATPARPNVCWESIP